MTILVVGASGATGKLLVALLLQAGQKVKVIVRPTSVIPAFWNSDDNVTIIKECIAEIHVEDMAKYLADCQAMVSCLGHNLTWKGIYGKPRKLVADAVRTLCEAVLKNIPIEPMKFVLMNTAGNCISDLDDPISFGQKMVIGLLRPILPPLRDNEKAADYLRVDVGPKHPFIEWVAVRPDSLVNEECVTAYSVHRSPTRSAIFDPGKTSRINVGHFIARLITDDMIWNTWKGQMPVIYNEISRTK
ncbi:NAD(P)-dependent oxidoreductase [Parapedobacter sp. DT-150]|uniref:NAD(P)-dependent oxidoreductase n=1 Tax=Parapedobacter sp. DT-150 TaxID=3396162 RepID=UPI003F1D54A5